MCKGIAWSIKDFYKNPIFLFGFVVLILSIILLVKCNFTLPDYYIDRTAADNIAQTVSPKEVSSAVSPLRNPNFIPDNTIFHIWGYFIAILLFSIIFRIKDFKSFTNLTIFNKKLFAFLWINISYPIISYLYVSSYMADLGKHVYNGAADSMGIPFFTMISVLVLYGIIYYPLTNLLTFATYNTKIKRIFYIIIWIAITLLWIVCALDIFTYKFIYNNILLDFCHIVWIFYGIYSIKYIKTKPKMN